MTEANETGIIPRVTWLRIRTGVCNQCQLQSGNCLNFSLHPLTGQGSPFVWLNFDQPR